MATRKPRKPAEPVEETTPVDEPAGQVDHEEPAEPVAAAAPTRKDPRLCTVPGCVRPGVDVLRGLCGAHYASRRGDGS